MTTTRNTHLTFDLMAMGNISLELGILNFVWEREHKQTDKF